jgi:hypothetical protein
MKNENFTIEIRIPNKKQRKSILISSNIAIALGKKLYNRELSESEIDIARIASLYGLYAQVKKDLLQEFMKIIELEEMKSKNQQSSLKYHDLNLLLEETTNYSYQIEKALSCVMYMLVESIYPEIISLEGDALKIMFDKYCQKIDNIVTSIFKENEI